MVFTYVSCFRSSNGLTAWPDLVVIAQVTLPSLKNANGEQNWATSASSQATCQNSRIGHLPVMIMISATEPSNFLCKRPPQATHAHTEQLLYLRWHYTSRSPRLLQSGCIYYATISLASQLLPSPILLLFIRADRLFRIPPQLAHACTPPLKVITQNASFPSSSAEQAVLCFSPSRLLLQQFLQEEVIYPELKHLVIMLPG